MTDVSIALAVAAGALSFVSPCVLALLPVYLAFLGDDRRRGTGVGGDRDARGSPAPGTPLRRRIQHRLRRARHVDRNRGGRHSSGFRRFVRSPAWSSSCWAWSPPGSSDRSWIAQASASTRAGCRRRGRHGRIGLGSLVAIGWTPCIGPVLGAILTMGASSGSVPVVALLLTAYSVGLAIPFLVAASRCPRSDRWSHGFAATIVPCG